MIAHATELRQENTNEIIGVKLDKNLFEFFMKPNMISDEFVMALHSLMSWMTFKGKMRYLHCTNMTCKENRF